MDDESLKEKRKSGSSEDSSTVRTGETDRGASIPGVGRVVAGAAGVLTRYRGEVQPLTGEEPFRDWEVYPTSLWNYGLRIDTDDPAAAVDIDAGTPGDVPFSPVDPPMELSVTGRLVPDWRLDPESSWAGSLPQSPVRSNEPPEPGR